jgi:peptidoglycan/LPS O-acetylase OafA/YrhL
MRKNIGILDSLRGGAASYVLLYHLNQMFPFSYNFLNYIFRFGQEAVILFFILSGFVIVYSTNKEIGFPQYFIKRFRRIYPLFLIALLLGYIVECLNMKSMIVPDFKILFANIFNLQDFETGKPGVWFPAFSGNLPLWSLSYEWWFYMLFYPIYKFVPEGKQMLVVLLCSLAGLASYYLFPNQISLFLLYFIIWWSGVELGKIFLHKEEYTLKRTCFIWSSLMLFILLLFFAFYFDSKENLQFGLHPVLEIRHFSAAFLFVITGILWSRIKFMGIQVFDVFKMIAPISFALYIYHYPLLVILQLPAGGSVLVQKIVLFVVLIIFSFLMEIKLQGIINRWSDPLIKKQSLKS